MASGHLLLFGSSLSPVGPAVNPRRAPRLALDSRSSCLGNVAGRPFISSKASGRPSPGTGASHFLWLFLESGPISCLVWDGESWDTRDGDDIASEGRYRRRNVNIGELQVTETS